MKSESVKQWNNTPCGSTEISEEYAIGTREYFDAIKRNRYQVSDEWMMRKIPFQEGKGKKVLEIGFGMGTDLLNWRQNGAEVYGIDIVEEHHRLAQLNFKVHNETAHLQLADAAAIPFSDNTFDIVYSNGVLHHTPDTVRCISEAFRVLKPGGKLIFSMYRTYSAFHLVSTLWLQGIRRGNLKKLGYRGLLSLIEKGADGIHIKPLVKTYRRAQLKHMLSDFSEVKFDVGHFKKDHLAELHFLSPKFLEKFFEKWLGWYLITYAIK